MLSIIRYYNKNVFIIFIILCREPFFAGGEAPALYPSINTLKNTPLRGLGSPLSIFKTFYYRIYNKDITNIYNKYILKCFFIKMWRTFLFLYNKKKILLIF